VLRPQYFVFDLYVNLLKDTVLQQWTEDMPVLSGTDNGAAVTVDAVDTVITVDDTGYAVAAVNKDPENPQTVELRLLDDAVTEMRIHTVNGPAPDSYNDIDKTEVGITVTDWMPFDGSVTLAPHSVNVIELR
jgi:alpha-N-arabinofuranosidase